MEFKREKERMLQSYLQTMKFLNDSSEETLYLCDIAEQKVYLSNNVSEKYHLPALDNGFYTVEQIRNFVYAGEDRHIFLNPDAFDGDSEKVIHQDYRIVNGEGTKFWIHSTEKLQCDENGEPMWIIGRISDNEIEQKIDLLTGLYNTKKLVEDLEECLAKQQNGFLVVLGIDNFKNINNKYGRSFGNHMLKNVAERLEDLVEAPLRVYRLDSDKFAINAIECSKNDVESIYFTIQDKISVQCTLSAGAAEYNPEALKDVDTIYQYAENALDRAKKNGKDVLEFFSEDAYVEQMELMEFQEELKYSVEHQFEGFSLCYQPQIDAKTYEIQGVEALLRYDSPTKGRVSPLEFVPILEQTEMIVEVGEWVLRTAMQQCKIWREHLPELRMSINFSYIQLRDETIVDCILNLLEELKMPGEALTLEITESIQLQDYQYFNKIFYKLEKYGVRVAIDDFGTGYSSLSYLKSIAIDKVKIDKCFISGIQHSAYNYRLLSNMIELAHSADIRVCCEGVETEAELQALRELHPDLMQGYLFAKPHTVAEFEESYICQDSIKYQEKKQQAVNFRLLEEREKIKAQGQVEQEKMATIVDGMEEIVYVRDPKSYELFYLNAVGREITGMYDYKGRKCYEVLQGKKSPCEFCQSCQEKTDSYNVWEFYSKHLQRHWIIKDKHISWAGQDAQLSICLDVTEREVMSQKVREKLDFEQNIVAATKMLVEEEDRGTAINGMLALIGEFYDADRAYLFELQDNKEFWTNTYEWCGKDVVPQIEFLQNVPLSATQRWKDNFRKGESIVVEDVEDLKDISPEEYETLSVQGIQSLIVSPVWRNSEAIGFIGVDDPKKHKNDFGQVQTMAYFLADRLTKDDTKQRLGELLNLHYEDILKETKLGLWVIRIDPNGGPSQMFADQTMLNVMGVKGEVTPEECYDFWYSRINDGYFHYVNDSVAYMIESGKIVELGYTWKHPTKGEVTVRCVGRRVADSDGMICVEGYHRAVNEVERPKFISEETSIIFEYNEKKQSVYFHNDRGSLAGQEEKEENFPKCWIDKGMVHPHFVSQFEAVFTDIKNQPEIEYKEFLLKTKNGVYDWFYLTTRALSKEEQDADTMIIILESASQERAMEIQYMRLKDFYKATLSEKIAYMEVDLESRHVLDIGGVWAAYKEEAMGEDSNYWDVLTRYKEALIHPEDLKAYAEFIGENLQDGIPEENNHTKKIQYRRLLDGRMQWVELTAHIFVEQYSENLYALIYLRNIDAEKRRELEQETAATRDHLTGVFNRRTFEYEVEKHMMSGDSNHSSTLIMLDIDNFKQINDTNGHVEGDAVLKQLADVLMSTFRKRDLLGRLGGDEFMIFLKNLSDREIINRRIEEFRAAFAKANSYHSTCSIGITEVKKEGFSYEESLKKADLALYRSKEKGKNTYSYYED